LFLFHPPSDYLHLHSFPTRRSSDLSLRQNLLQGLIDVRRDFPGVLGRQVGPHRVLLAADHHLDRVLLGAHSRTSRAAGARRGRSDRKEHTSELQSRRDLVCRLLLEKKKASTTKSTTVATLPGSTPHSRE